MSSSERAAVAGIRAQRAAEARAATHANQRAADFMAKKRRNAKQEAPKQDTDKMSRRSTKAASKAGATAFHTGTVTVNSAYEDVDLVALVAALEEAIGV